MSAWRGRWESFWFAPESGFDLAVSRLIVVGYLCAYTARSHKFELATRLFAEESWSPISFFRWLPPALPGPETYGALLAAYQLCLVFACVGLFTRTACGLSFGLGLYVVGLGHNFGKVSHPEHVSLLILGILACARSGDRLSLDAWLRRRRGQPPPPLRSGEYRWPLRCAWLALLGMFFAAGTSKLRFGGLEWAFSDSFSNLLIAHHYRKPELGGLGLWLAEQRGLAQTLAASSLALELLAPLALASSRLRLAIVPGLFLMQLGIALLMHTHTRSPNFACYAFFVPWERCLGALRKSAGGGHAAAILAAAGLALLAGCRAERAPQATTLRPNLVVILADDLRADALGPSFQSFARTPALDRLAAEGVRFDNAFAMTAACNPSRASLLSGRFTHRSGVSENRVGPAQDPAPALALRLQRAGYRTAFLGKYHMDESCHPREGFDRWGCLEGNYGQGDYLDARLQLGDGEQALPGHSTDALAELAATWIAELSGAPFFLLLALKSPHVPMLPTLRHQSLYADAQIEVPASAHDALERLPLAMQVRPQNGALLALSARLARRGDPRAEVRREYARSLADLDDALARIDRALETSGAREQTLLAFTSDNGVLLGEHGLWRKEVAYEEAMRVPLLLRHPAELSPGLRRSQLVLNVDLPATLLARAEGAAPAGVDGRDLYALASPGAAPLTPPWREDFLYLAPYPAGGRPALLALRGERWKYVRHVTERVEEELFDLAEDPGERRNQAGSAAQAATLAECREALTRALDAQQLPRAWLEAGARRRSSHKQPHSR